MTVLVSPAPARSLQQRRDALDRANHIRFGRAQLKRDLKASRVDPCDVLADVPEFAARMKVAVFLEAVPRLGPVKCGRLLRRHSISPSKTLGGLTSRQRSALMTDLALR